MRNVYFWIKRRLVFVFMGASAFALSACTSQCSEEFSFFKGSAAEDVQVEVQVPINDRTEEFELSNEESQVVAANETEVSVSVETGSSWDDIPAEDSGDLGESASVEDTDPQEYHDSVAEDELGQADFNTDDSVETQNDDDSESDSL